MAREHRRISGVDLLGLFSKAQSKAAKEKITPDVMTMCRSLPALRIRRLPDIRCTDCNQGDAA